MQTLEITDGPASVFTLEKYRKSVGRSEATVWRWRRDGWLETIDIAGKPYVTAEAIAALEARMRAREFSKPAVAAKSRAAAAKARAARALKQEEGRAA